MRAGELRHSLAIEQKAVTQDANGNRSEAWETLVECWGKVEPGRGREFWSAKATVADLSHNVTIRFFDGIREDMRISFQDPKRLSGTPRYFNIRSIVNVDERDHMLLLLCTEVKF